jgi:spermidine synthase
MAVYREIEEGIHREYTLTLEPIHREETEHALLEIVPLKLFGRSLFLDGQLQFTEKDEYIYHEALVHPCLACAYPRNNVCIIGGGDGCAAREVMKWSDVKSIDILDWDKRVTDLFTQTYRDMNSWSLLDPRVQIENHNIRDSLHDNRSYDCIIVDLLDPNPEEEGQIDLWYDILFMTKHWILPGGSIVINAGGITPWETDRIDWLANLVQERIQWNLHVYKVFVPSFAKEWCFLLLTQSDTPSLEHLPGGLRFLTKQAWKYMYSYGWTIDYRRNLNLNLQDQLSEDDE